MSYRLVVERAALKALADLKKHPLYSQIRSTVEGLAQTPRPPNCIKLTNSQLWRVPVGTYRILYSAAYAMGLGKSQFRTLVPNHPGSYLNLCVKFYAALTKGHLTRLTVPPVSSPMEPVEAPRPERGKYYAWYHSGPVTSPHMSRWDRVRERIALLGYYWDRLQGIPEDMND